MTNNIQTLYFDSIIHNLNVSNKKQFFKKISQHVSRLIGTPENFLMNIFTDVERKQNSSVGNGVAVTNISLPRLTKPMFIFVKLENAIDFEAIDDQPVDLLCLMLSPEFEGQEYLGRLSKTIRTLSNEKICKDLRHSQDADDIRDVMRMHQSQKMAA